MKKYLQALVAIFIFLLSQVVAGLIAVAFFKVLDSIALAFSLVVASLLSIVAIWFLKIANHKSTFRIEDIDWKWAGIGIFAALCGIVASDLLSEIVKLPNLLEEEFNDMSKTFVGVLGIGIIGPIAEEMTFREGVCGSLVRGGVRPIVCVVVSALCFGLIHANPAQIPFAFIVGLILAIIYIKIGNIIITSIIHIINNMFAVVMMATDNGDVTILDRFGNVSMGVLYIVMLTIGCIWLLRDFWHKYTPKLSS